MAAYLLQVGYTPDAWAAQVKNPRNVVDRIRPAVDALGGRIECVYYAFGEYDLVAVAHFPENVSAAAFSIAAAAGGAVRSLQTTPLMSVDDGLSAMAKAAGAGYRPPS